MFINVPYFENKFEFQEKFFLKWFKRLESVKTHAEKNSRWGGTN